MLSWGWNSNRHTSNSEYGRFDFGTARMRQPANGLELRQGNNTSYIHQTPQNNGYHTSGCPHTQQYYSQAQNHQPGCQHWTPTQGQEQGDSSLTPKFTVQVGDAAAAAALGGNVTLQGQSQYYMPESPYVSEGGGSNLINYPHENPEQEMDAGTQIPKQTQSAYELGSKSSKQVKRKPPLKQNIVMNSASFSETNFQDSNRRERKSFSNAPRFKLCGRCPKCKILKVPDQGPVVATFPANNVGRNRKVLNQNFMNLEGKNFRAIGNR